MSASNSNSNSEVSSFDLTPPNIRKEIEEKLASYEELAPDGFLLIDPKRHLYAVLIGSPAHGRVRNHSMGDGPTYSAIIGQVTFEGQTFGKYYLPPYFFEFTAES